MTKYFEEKMGFKPETYPMVISGKNYKGIEAYDFVMENIHIDQMMYPDVLQEDQYEFNIKDEMKKANLGMYKFV